MGKIAFWYEFASTYSYLTAMRIDEAAQRADVEVEWKPFLLGPIFKAQGWTSSPFNLFPAKGRYMVRDIERIAADRGLRFQMPDPFPANGLHAARIATAGRADGWCAPFTRAVFKAQFADGKDISDADVLASLLANIGVDSEAAFAAAGLHAAMDQLRLTTEEAQARGIFGAPSFTTEDGELFWGDDRLEQALAWAQKL
ncbi:2-hydroxychromene-2-carboxylate isomerase [Hyphomicrobium sulfonivorans]|uniref:2-hydroxychromene-2-carboxylate isomerase n=1 Tax=Hyphomicrobium sulfonivorans TaxID=121290 RepID=A0A109BMS4_HYPSL|nr:2-hydroxychromene-2-carboxylate isomerase [Hyphomicrobium sulfonivorans]KWT71536.1 2-hydroxychromene-2-carboxylate isomerase [Hyphomicrobium sulfonivorans]